MSDQLVIALGGGALWLVAVAIKARRIYRGKR